GLDFGAGPLLVGGKRLLGVDLILLAINAPDGILRRATGQIEKVDSVKSLGSRKLGRQPRNIIGRANDKHLRSVVIKPREERAEHASRNTAVRGTGARNPTQGFVDFV